MSERPNDSKNTSERKGFAAFFLKRVVFAVLIIAAVLWGLSLGIEQLGKWQAWKGQDSEEKPAALAVKPAEPEMAPTVAPPPASAMAPESTGTTAAGFTMFVVGEGIEKKQDDFAAEVAAQVAAAKGQ